MIVTSGLESLQNQASILSRDARLKAERAVLLPPPHEIAAFLTPTRLVARHPSVRTHDALELRRHRVRREFEQFLLALGGRHPGDRADLLIARFTAPESLVDPRKVPERPRH